MSSPRPRRRCRSDANNQTHSIHNNLQPLAPKTHGVILMTTLLIYIMFLLQFPTTMAAKSLTLPWGYRRSMLTPLLSIRDDPLVRMHSTAVLLRGGDVREMVSTGDEQEDDAKDDDGKDEATSPEESSSSTSTSKSEDSGAVVVTVKTNLGHDLLDQSIEMNVARKRDVASVKTSLARQWPGKPPAESVRLLWQGQVLSDDMIVTELVDEDDEEEDGQGLPKVTLVLDMVPPVDPRFVGPLASKLDERSTADLLEAYTLNEAALIFSTQWWTSNQDKKRTTTDDADENDDEEKEDNESTTIASTDPPPLVALQLKETAQAIRDQLVEHLDAKRRVILEDEQSPVEKQAETRLKPQKRGQRLRPGLSMSSETSLSATIGLKQTIQHYLNINWGDTIRNFCLFIFFGLFGGRTVMSRVVLLLGAPLCFVVQARPVKLFFAELMYAVMRDPPSAVLTLLPAPQQALLSMSNAEGMKLIYGELDYAGLLDAGDLEDLKDDGLAESQNVEEDEDDEEQDSDEEEDSDED